MDPKDQTAIHEAMEQQTISIAKAGIHATLNARASILAAANPVKGRYDRSKNLNYNLNISAPIMSRFDLFYVVIDERDEFTDFNIAKHIVNLHKKQDEAIKTDFTQKEILVYLKYCRHIKPKMTKDAANILLEEYTKLRANDITSKKTAYRITVRQLESIIRLSEALAKVHADDEVRGDYVREACRLLSKSIIPIKKEDVEIEEAQDTAFNKIQKERIEQGTLTINQQEDVKMDEEGKDEGEAKTQMIQLSFEEYDKIGRQLIYFLKEKEKEDPDNFEGIQQKRTSGPIPKRHRKPDHRNRKLNEMGEKTQQRDPKTDQQRRDPLRAPRWTNKRRKNPRPEHRSRPRIHRHWLLNSLSIHKV
jgi:DNA replication licensing factor MCM6